jgi:hypothetical protein
MIFLRNQKMIFLRVPKTASTSLSYQILNHLEFQPGDFSTLCGKFKPRGFHFIQHKQIKFSFDIFKTDEHPWLDALSVFGIIEEHELLEYKIYGVLRNPVDRFFSMFTYLLTIELGNDVVAKMAREEIAERAFEILYAAEKNSTSYRYFKPKKPGAFPLYPQSNWLIHKNIPINNIIVYPNFSKLLLDFTGNDKLEFRENIKVETMNSSISDSTIREIHKWYPFDYKLWEHFSGAI